ncbi:hypothetical protein [Paenibacillus periandrae]|uniref:hypothetical protein n=1 Tax=Paenibacillus periandrae TaxID=1761741 RepID=UPI001F0931B0|nr:hypothetical protein [Paenibacillus periandrae]
MTQIMDFNELFSEWVATFQRIPKGEGHYDYENGGIWVSGYGEPEEMTAIIVALTYKDLNDLQFSPGGVYTRDDCKIYLQKPRELIRDDRVIYKGQEYLVVEQIPYDEYADFDIFIIKRVDTKGRDPVV